MQSYTTSRLGLVQRAREAVTLYRWHARNVPEQVRRLIEKLRGMEQLVEQHANVRLENLKMLDIGPGQKLYQMPYFSARNQVVGIDMDIVPQGFQPLVYLRMLKVNGLLRTGKTAVRQMLGLDAKFGREMAGQLGAPRPRKLTVLQMDASRMSFEDASFDFVYSFSVFEHIADPAAVLDEVRRILRPGGVAYISLHPYTSESGGHDARILLGNRDGIPCWSHLRPLHQDKVHSNSYLNKLRLGQWRQIFSERWPGVHFECLRFHEERFAAELAAIRALGELSDYSDEEVLTGEFVAIWKKPLPASAGLAPLR